MVENHQKSHFQGQKSHSVLKVQWLSQRKSSTVIRYGTMVEIIEIRLRYQSKN